jgi:protease IV
MHDLEPQQAVVFASPDAGKKSSSAFASYLGGVARMFGNIFFAITSVLVSFVLIGLLFSPLALLGQSVESEVGQHTPTEYVQGKEDSEQLLMSIPIKGTILNEGSPSIFSGLDDATYGFTVKQMLVEAAKNDAIKGIVLEIDSPGGTVTGSQAIADGIAAYKKTGKPVLASITGLAASGGYWAAIGADKVYADVGSLIGSIGVVFGPFTFYDKPLATDGGLFGGGIVTQNGIEQTYITAGNSKDLGNPFRRITPAEQAVLQEGVNNDYTLFVDRVSSRRSLDAGIIRNQIGALVYDNKQAQTLGLIDGTKNRDQVYQELATAANLGDDYAVKRYSESESGLQSLLGAAMIYSGKQRSATEQLSFDLCSAIQRPLAYHGNVAQLCK